MSWATSLMTTVLLISKKFWRWALASSCAFALNEVACIMLMRLGLSSNLRFGPVWMFSVLGAENSRSVFSAIASKIVLGFLLIGLILIDGICRWITTNPAIPFIKYEQRQTRVSLLKQRCIVMISSISIYLINSLLALCPSRQCARNACCHPLASLFTKLLSLVMMLEMLVGNYWEHPRLAWGGNI
jgi:hypothetical protein